jgi:NADH:ubiquinone oxidoreductase subunit 3 (subunit A)
MEKITKLDLIAIFTFLVVFLTGISAGITIARLIGSDPTTCTDYTLNQYEAGDVPVECINLFLEEYEL